jgi:metal-sulfur cluster biosynthetic enzyme
MENIPDMFQQVNDVLKKIIDPELGVNIVDLGLVYEISISEHQKIKIRMTLTTPGCPMSQHITGTVTCMLEEHFPEYTAEVELVWLPLWDPEMITVEGQAQLNGDFDFNAQEASGSLWDRWF